MKANQILNQYKPVPVQVAKEIAERFGKDWVVILGYDGNHKLTHTTTYGVKPGDKVDAAHYGEIAARSIGCDTSKSNFYEDFRRDFSAAKMAMLKAMVDEFNVRYPVGTVVVVRMDSGEFRTTKTRSKASVLSGHTAVIWLDGISGCYALDRVLPTSAVVAKADRTDKEAGA